MLTKKDIFEAKARISNRIVETPIVFSSFLSNLLGAEVFLKLENLQHTGSFKERGALNFLLLKANKKPVVAASAGNHAQAVAFHAGFLGIPAIIFMPKNTPNIKVLQTESYKAKVKLVGDTYDEAYRAAKNFCEQESFQYVHAYDDKDIIAGQGTIGLEIHEQIAKPDIIIVPVGGGGLISGIASYFKDDISYPKIIGVDIRNNNLKKVKTIAEGIAVKSLGKLAYSITKELKIEFLTITDTQIEKALMLLFERQKIVSEGAGAASLAALLSLDKYQILNKKIVLVISGGNIDISLLAKLTDKELIRTNRLCRISVMINDTPGSLSRLLANVTKCSANIMDVFHERAFSNNKWNEVQVLLTVEIKDGEHEKNMIKMLSEQGFYCSKVIGFGDHCAA